MGDWIVLWEAGDPVDHHGVDDLDPRGSPDDILAEVGRAAVAT
jgi:hypothetical protein